MQSAWRLDAGSLQSYLYYPFIQHFFQLLASSNGQEAVGLRLLTRQQLHCKSKPACDKGSACSSLAIAVLPMCPGCSLVHAWDLALGSCEVKLQVCNPAPSITGALRWQLPLQDCGALPQETERCRQAMGGDQGLCRAGSCTRGLSHAAP